MRIPLANRSICTSLGFFFCSDFCCGAEDMEASIEQNIALRMLPSKNIMAPVSSRNSKPCKNCGPVLRDIFLLVDQKGTEQRPTPLRCGACGKHFSFSAKCHQHTTKNCAIVVCITHNFLFIIIFPVMERNSQLSIPELSV